MPYARRKVLSLALLQTAIGLSFIASALLLPLHTAFSTALALGGAFVLCRVASRHVQRVLIVTTTIALLLVLGAFDRTDHLKVGRMASPNGQRAAWLVQAQGTWSLYVDPPRWRVVLAMFGAKSGSQGWLHTSDVEDARIIWARDGHALLVVGRARGEVARKEERILGMWDPRRKWHWEPVPEWLATMPPWLAPIDVDGWTEPVVRARDRAIEQQVDRLIDSNEVYGNPQLAIDLYGLVDDMRFINDAEGRNAILLGRPRWELLWAEGRLANGEHVLTAKDPKTQLWSSLDPWATRTPQWLRTLQADDEDGLVFDVPYEEKARLCNCRP
jgi:hypothetical protein